MELHSQRGITLSDKKGKSVQLCEINNLFILNSVTHLLK